MTTDIRNRPTLDHTDVTALNFIRPDPPYLFRRHYRHGLRSHIMEILDPADVAVEQAGTIVDGIRQFPRATPCRMFRIFRTRLKTLDEALSETGRVKTVERFLAPDFMATSTEVIVDYRGPDGYELLLCGFQTYVDGEILDPWTLLDTEELLSTLFDAIGKAGDTPPLTKAAWMAVVRQQGTRFVRQIKRMVNETRHIPDLAGAGNLIINGEGNIQLVDINNISPVTFDATIHLDEKGYPVCDKSVEALALIEKKILGRSVDRNIPIYRHFFDPQRKTAVNAKEASFWQAHARKS
ncbi:hypothetical protein [Desulfosarcina ovata]|uniref:Uncharacterized protein n=1 Tax=Desulfosarcina ovata subsp. ovata TaxID=2752305 RepID=A0A5K8ACF5_9BACT|nr:hypothetical protein [Desulfosarcina ovata]BBO90221.1 hypothetical protein DSCOOX_34010 [Desulfosarcina ovata subsp. ovata]